MTPKPRPTTSAVRENLARVRRQRGYSLRQLSARLGDHGYPISHASLSQIENGSRGVDVDDLTALAAVLGISPAGLLMPRTASPDTVVALTGMSSIQADRAWRWITARDETDDMSVLLSKPVWTVSVTDLD